MTWRKVWREKDKMTLRKKLMLSFLILVLLMGSMIGYFSYQNAKNLVVENKEQEMADTINRIDISINSQVQQINRLAENVKSSQIVRAYLKKEIHTQEETEELNDWMEGGPPRHGGPVSGFPAGSPCLLVRSRCRG